MSKHLTRERLRELLDYDPLTGLFVWKSDMKNGTKVGNVAGTVRNGYIDIGVDGKQRGAHRLAFLWMTGRWPKDKVDHENGVSTDNRWKNLREANSQQNSCNAKLAKNNNSGFRGVSRHSMCSKYQARIKVCGKTYFLGLYETAEEAAQAYNGAAALCFGNEWMRKQS